MSATIFNIQKFSIHDGPGIRTVVFFKGCPLRCQWCSNPESWFTCIHPSPTETFEYTERNMTLEDVLKEVKKDLDFYEESGGGVTLSGGEVLLWPEFAATLLARLQKEHLHTAIETTGYAAEPTFQKVAAHTDLLLFDMKHHDPTQHKKYTGVSNELILKNMSWAVRRNIPIIARIPVIPGINNTPADAEAFRVLLKNIGIAQVHLLPFHQFGQKKYDTLQMEYALKDTKALHPEDLKDFKYILQTSGLDVKI